MDKYIFFICKKKHFYIYAWVFILFSCFNSQTYAFHKIPGFAYPPHHIKPKTPSEYATGLTPKQIVNAYGFSKITAQGEGQIIGIIDAFDNPNAEADLAVFNQKFDLPPCTTSNGCFIKLYANGTKPAGNANWGLEIALDIQWAHAVAPKAKILLIEAQDNSFSALIQAIQVAIKKGANVISMSWGGDEFYGESEIDEVFNVPDVTFTAASGDAGTGVIYPAVSPYVIAVGGTSLSVDAAGNYVSEVAWSGSGGGLSLYENEPSYQTNFPIPNNPSMLRGVPDVSYNANPYTGFSVYDTYGHSGWLVVGGTSAGAPQWAGLIAIAKSAALQKLNLTNENLYFAAKANYTLNFHDIIEGSNGTCGYYCETRKGYDYVTGIGTPKVDQLVGTLIKS